MRSGVALMAAVFVSGCAASPHRALPVLAQSAEPLAITRVGVEPKTIDVSRREAATVRYALSHPAAVTLDLVDEEGRIVRHLDTGEQAAGFHTAIWDGLDADGRPVSSGVCRYVLHALTAEDGRRTAYDPSGQTGGEELTVRDFTFDRKTGTLQWVMPKAGYARLRVGLEGFPHLRTLLDWEPLEAGEHVLEWDGLDASGLIRLSEHPNLSIKLSAFALPDNTIIVHGSSQAMDDGLPATNPPYLRLARSDAAYFHARHPRAVCHDVAFRVEFPEARRRTAEGYPVVSGVVPVRVTLDERDAPHLVNQRFELMLYEDLVGLFEEEESLNPFTFLWDTSQLPPGVHVLTVNILSYDDHYGVVTQAVLIERAA